MGNELTDERRQSVRSRVDFACSWRRDARVSDLSLSGCYVDTRHAPAVGSHAELEIALPDGDITVRGAVSHSHPNAGFALQFERLDEEARMRIASVLNDTRSE
jgi:hypothetical protein